MYLGLGIEFVLKIAHLIAAAPGAGLPVKSFAPSAIFFLTLALLSVVLWRSALLRLTAVPFLLIGLLGRRRRAAFRPGRRALRRDGGGAGARAASSRSSARGPTTSPPSNGCAPTPTPARQGKPGGRCATISAAWRRRAAARWWRS